MKRVKQKKQIYKNEHLLKSFYNAMAGLKTAFAGDNSLKLGVFLTLFIIPFALFLGATAIERILLMSSWFLVLIVELVNSAIETIVDRIGLEFHPLSKKIKDVSAAAVLLSIINVVIVWLIILLS
jgi:diacylglycerol kinase (ATP)